MDFPRALVFFGLFFLFYLGLQFYLYRRLREFLLAGISRPRLKALCSGLLAAFFLVTLSPFVARLFVGWQVYGSYDLGPRVGFTLLAVWVFGSTGAAGVLMLYDLWCWAWRPRPGSDTSDRADVPDLARRRLIKSGIGLAAAAPFLISGHGVIRGRRRFQIDHFDLPVGSVSSPLANFSIVHLTDIHVGPYLTGEELSEYVEAANRLKPDLVALTGDFVSTGFGDVEPCAVALAQLRARYGVFACLGNHEVLAGVEDVLAERLRAAGIEVLRNDARSLRLGHTVLNVLGIDDLKWGVPRLGRALAAAREPGEFNLLLSHRPEVFPQAADRTIHLVLSGHYHGGQVKLSPHPEGLSIARLITPYAEGLFELRAGASREKALLFVGRGVGITGLPIRVNCPPQIAHLTLARTEKA